MKAKTNVENIVFLDYLGTLINTVLLLLLDN